MKSHPRCLWQGYHSLHAYTPATERWADWEHLDRRSAEWRGSKDVKFAGLGFSYQELGLNMANMEISMKIEYSTYPPLVLMDLLMAMKIPQMGCNQQNPAKKRGNRNSFLLLLNGLWAKLGSTQDAQRGHTSLLGAHEPIHFSGITDATFPWPGTQTQWPQATKRSWRHPGSSLRDFIPRKPDM